MNRKNELTIKYFINVCFFLYFLILIGERLASLILTFVNNVNIFSSAFYIYVYAVLVLSIVAFIVYISIFARAAIKAMFKINEANIDNIPFKHLCIGATILLLSGMVHTEYTLPVTQFISYGFLIVAILLKVIISNHLADSKPLLWLSFSYLIAFSMAIPVMYQSNIDLHILFHISEAVTSILLVALFGYMMLLIFNEKEDLFNPLYIIVAVILDGLLIGLRWVEEINYFVLIFISLSLILFIVGTIFKYKKR